MFEFIPFLHKITEKILEPILRCLFLRLKITPNKMSVLSFLTGSLAVIFIFFKEIEIALVVLLLALIFDILDGALARYFKLESKLGKNLELIFDRTNETMLFLALAYIGLTDFKIAVLAIIAILLMTAVRDRSQFDPGLKRIMLFAGYFLNNFQIALTIVFFANLLGFIISLLLIDYQKQMKIDGEMKT